MNRRGTVAIAVVLVAITGAGMLTVTSETLSGVAQGEMQPAQSVSNGTAASQASSNASVNPQETTATLSLDVPQSHTAIDGEVVRLDIEGPPNDQVSYEWRQTGGPDTALMADGTATPWLVTPDVHSTTTLTFEVEVSNGQTTETTTTNVTVEPNESPSAAIEGSHHVTEDESFLLDGTGSSDPDGESLRYEWVQTAGPDAELGNTNDSTLAVTAPWVSEPTSVRFQLSVDDSHGERDTETRAVTVYPDSDATHGGTDTTDALVDTDGSMNLNERELTYYQVDLVAGEPLSEFGDADSNKFYSDQERLIQWVWGHTDDRVTNRGRPSTIDEGTANCVDSETIGIDGETATVDVTVADGCAVELSLVTYVKSEPGFDRETASEQVLYDTTTATVGPGQYTFTVAVPDSE